LSNWYWIVSVRSPADWFAWSTHLETPPIVTRVERHDVSVTLAAM
jgi:hypothetical protein